MVVPAAAVAGMVLGSEHHMIRADANLKLAGHADNAA
jgi:hypothetical protein